MGWIGTRDQLLHVLRCFGCDTDEEGKFLVKGKIVSYMGAGEEFVIDDDAVAYINGKPTSITGLLSGTSYGMKVTVL